MKRSLVAKRWSKYYFVYFFIFAIVLTQIVVIYLNPAGGGNVPSAAVEETFASNFIEWFGVLYSILLPLILVRVWEQLDDIDREFDREADAVRIFYEDLSFLREDNETAEKKLSTLIRDYVRHVIRNYPFEVKESNDVRRIGDNILIRIRKQFKELFSSNAMEDKKTEFLVKELFQRLNEIVDIRGDRIGFASQRLFDMFRIVALVVSIIFIIPFYVVGLTIHTTALDYLLLIGVTFLVIFVYLIIEDFDEPFGGTWKIDVDSWNLLREDIVDEERNRQLSSREKKDLSNTIHPSPSQTDVTN